MNFKVLIYVIALALMAQTAWAATAVMSVDFEGDVVDSIAPAMTFTEEGGLTYSTDARVGLQSVDFDGSADYVNVTGYTNLSKLNLSGGGEIWVWVQWDDETVYNLAFGWQGHGGNPLPSTEGGLDMGNWPSGDPFKVEGRLGSSPAANDVDGCQNTGGQTVATDTWYLHGLTWTDAGVGNVTANLIESCTFTTSSGNSHFPSINPLMGFTGDNQDLFSNGHIDELCILDTSVTGPSTAEERETFYASGLGNVTCNAAFDPVVVPPTETQLDVRAQDVYFNIILTNYSVTIYNLTDSFTNTTTSGGLVSFGQVSNETVWNVTVTSNNSGGYFDVINTTIIVNGTTQVNITPFQAYIRLNATELFTNFTILEFNVTDLNQSNTTIDGIAVLLLPAGTFTFVANASQYFNATTTIDVTALLNDTFYISFGNALVNVTSYNRQTNDTVSDFSLNITPTNLSNNIFVSTTGAQLFDILVLKGYNYTFTTNYSGGNHESQTREFRITETFNNFSMFTTSVHTINLLVLDEQTNMVLNFTSTNETVNFEFLGPSNLNFSTFNGSLFVANLSTGLYEIRYVSSGFNKRSFFVNLPAGGSADLRLYLLNDTDSTLVVVSIADESDTPLNGSILQLQRFYVSDNTFRTVEMTRADFNGDAPIHLVADSQDYRFIVLDVDRASVLFVSEEARITDTSVRIQIRLGGKPFAAVSGVNNVLTTFSHEQDLQNNTFSFSYLDTAGFVTGACLIVEQVDRTGFTKVCDLCSVGTGSTLSCNINTTKNLIATALINTTNSTIIVGETTADNAVSGRQVFGTLGIFMALLLFVGLMSVTIWSPEAALVASAISLGFSAWIGFIDIIAAAGFGFIFTGILLFIKKGRPGT